MKLGKRHVRRGHLAKVRDEKRGWVARMREGPQFPRRFDPRGDVLEALTSGQPCVDLAPRAPWSPSTEFAGEESPAPHGAAAIVACDAIDFGGGYQLLEEARAASSASDSPRLLALDYFVDAVQIERAARSGADAVWLVARLPDANLDELVRVAREVGLEPIVECATADEATAARSLGVRIAAFSFRDRDHHRVVAPEASLVSELGNFPLAVAVSVEEVSAATGFRAVFARRVC